MVERNWVTRGQGLCLVSEKCPAISSYTYGKKTRKILLLRAERIHLVNQFCLKLCSFLSKLIQKVGASFWGRGNPKDERNVDQSQEECGHLKEMASSFSEKFFLI